MAAYLLLAGFFGDGWLGELGRQGQIAPWTLGLGHLAVSGVYGILFVLATRPLLRLTSSQIVQVSAGAIYGLLLYGLASAFFLPRVLEGSLALPTGHLLAAHLLYGLSLALRGSGR